jgi:hypothetical protein
MPKVWQTSTATNGYFDAAGTNFATTMTEDRRPNTFHDLELGYFGVGTMEFPWLHSAGLDVASGADSVKFVIAPANGLMQTNVRSRTNSPDYFEGVTSSNVNGPQLGWEYQPGTIFGEEIYRSLGTHRILLEVRLRRLITRIGRQGVWKMDVLRHFGSKAELDQAVQEFCRAGHPECKTVQPSAPKQLRRSDILNAAAILRTEQRQQPQLMHEPDALNALAPGALMQTANVGPADEISPALFAELTKQRKLKSVFGRRWLGGDTDPQASWAPFATSENSYIPKNYLGAFLPLTMKSCMHCHSSAGHHVNQFDKKPGSAVKPAAQDAQAFRTWYHFLQGNDTVFTYHPIATAAVTTKTQLFSSTEGPVNPGAVDSCKVGARSSAPAPTSPLAGATTTLPSTPFPTPTPPQGPAPFSIARGQQLWQQSCATSGCHTQKVAASAWTNIASGTNASQTMRSVLSRLRLSAEQIEDLRNFLNARD